MQPPTPLYLRVSALFALYARQVKEIDSHIILHSQNIFINAVLVLYLIKV